MDVKTAGGTSSSSKSLAISLLVTGSLFATGGLTASVVPGGGDMLTAVVCVLLVGPVGMAFVSARRAVAFPTAAIETATRLSPTAVLAEPVHG